MRTPAISVKFKRFRRRHSGITAQRLVVRPRWPYALRLTLVLVVGLVIFFFGWFLRDEVGGGLADLRMQMRHQEAELATLRLMVGADGSVANMARGTQGHLMERLQHLERENAALKEDMLIFERLVPPLGGESELRIERFQVASDVGAGYRYRFLLAYRPGKSREEFRGEAQIVVRYQLEGLDHEVSVGDGVGADPLKIRYFLRKEGSFDLPRNAVLRSAELRILQAGKIRVRQEAG